MSEMSFKDYSFVFDIDGTLCPIKKKEEKYEDLVPYPEMIQKLRYYKNNGAKIVLYTSRNMNSYNGNIGLINKHTAAILSTWLEKWDIPYDEIVYGKVWPGHKGFYVDDRTIRPDEFLNYTVEELNEICVKSRPDNISATFTTLRQWQLVQTEQAKQQIAQERVSGQRKIDIVITMAGLGSRFRKAGYTVPKYMIEAKGKTLFEWSLLSLKGYEEAVNQYIFIAMKDENEDVNSFIQKQCKKLGIDNFKIIVLDYLTDGQATTAMLAERYWNEENALLIYNIDTYVAPGAMNNHELKGDGFIPCFKGEGDHWSFVRLDENGKVAEIKEKIKISDHCTLGAYYFKTCKLYRELYNEYYGQQVDNQGSAQKSLNGAGEKYVAPLYDYLLSKGGEIYISDVPIESVHVLGTPEELKQFLDE